MLVTAPGTSSLALKGRRVEDATVTKGIARSVRSRTAGRAVSCAAFTLVSLAFPAAFAQTSGPASAPPIVDGAVSGSLAKGGTLTFRVDGTAVGGWQNLDRIEADVVAGGETIEQLIFDIGDNRLALGAQEIVIRTGAVATGDYLRVKGADVVLTTGGPNISFSTKAEVIRAIPTGARFRLSVVDDFGRVAAATEPLEVSADQGLTWATVITAIVVALLAGSVFGNLFASKRRQPPRLSVYGAVQRQLDAGQEAATKKGTS